MPTTWTKSVRHLASSLLWILTVLLASGLASAPASATSTYGPPYYLVGGFIGTFPSLDAAVSNLASQMRGTCTTDCPTFYYYYYDSNARDGALAATVTTEPNTAGYSVFATEYVAQNPEKNLGGCAASTGGNGGLLGGSSPAMGKGDESKEAGVMCPGANFVGDPINASNGNKYQQDTDFRDNKALTFRRFYNSDGTVTSTAMGAHWRHSFDRSLSLHDALGVSNAPVTTATVYRPDGSVERFSKKTAGWIGAVNTPNVFTEQDDASGKPVGYTLFMGGPRETERYSTDGILLSVTDLSGATTTFAYSTASTPAQIAPRAGLLISVTEPNGRVLGLTYDGSGHVATVVLPDGGVLTYAYDTSNNLTSVEYPDGKTRGYVYNENTLNGGTSRPNAMTGVVDEKGVRFESTTYDSAGRAIAAGFAGNVDTYTVAYGQLRNTATTPLGQSTQLNFQSIQAQSHVIGSSTPCGAACAQPFQEIDYDANGQPTAYVDFKNNVTRTTLTASGLETSRTEAKNATTERTTATTWDTALRNPLTRSVTDASGTAVAKSGWAYNARGQMTATCDMDPTVPAAASYVCSATGTVPTGVRRTTMTYCDAVDTTQCPRVGLLLSVDGPRTDVADVTQYAYYLTTDESGCGTVGGACHRAGDTAQVTDALGHVTRVLAYDKAGRVVRNQDANGVISDVTYTPRGWLATRTVRANADGSASMGDVTTTLTYEFTGALKTVTDPDGVTQTLTYDDAHRLVDVADGQGNHVHYTLDASGNRVKEETFDAAGTSRRSFTRTYNALGQLATVTDGRGSVVFDATATGSYDANGNLVTAKDALGVVRKDTFDALDRLVTSVANVNGTDAATKTTTSAFTFDALDRLKGVTDPDGLVTGYGFDGLSNAIGQTSPDTGAQSATFDEAGNALTRTDAKATVTTQTFDAMGRRSAAAYLDASLNVAFHYDEANSVTGCAASFPIGRLTRVVETAVTTVYCYDRQGRVSELRQIQGTATDATDYAYTKAGRLAGVASPSGVVTAYGRDALGRITTVTVTPVGGASTPVVSAATYLPFGPLASYTLGNGQSVTRTYDANYEVTDVTSPALNLHFALDAAGNIVALGDAPGASPATETYTYDPLYRLTSIKDASGTAIESYTYSHAGDRLSKAAPGLATGTYGYKQGSHWLTGIGTASRAYDTNGSTTASANAGITMGYGYNARGQLTVLQQGGSTVATYVYEASGHRVSKTVGGATTRYAYGPGGLLGEYGGASRDYVWMDDLPVGVVDAAGVTFVHADGLNTPRVVTDATGASIWNWAYKSNAFGEVLPTSSKGYVLNLRFAGQYYDAESNTFYNVQRVYDPTTGRYLQSDPIGLNGGVGTYAYVSGNPLGIVDPLGLAEQSYAIEVAAPTPAMLAADKLLTRLATTAANNVDATCGVRCALPWIRGTLIHSEFKRLVDSTCPPSQYRTEVSYKDGSLVPYGTPGSSRADVVFGPVQKPTNVYDLKTGWAYITYGQAKAYGANLPPGTSFSEIRPDGR